MKKEPEFKSQNHKVANDFYMYCMTHPKERFWQALRNWSGKNFIWTSKIQIGEMKKPANELEDTFYWDGKNK